MFGVALTPEVSDTEPKCQFRPTAGVRCLAAPWFGRTRDLSRTAAGAVILPHRLSPGTLHMTGSIHRGMASELQDRGSSAAHSIAVPPEIVRKWQEFVDLLSEIMHVPSASIMRVEPPHIKVFVSSTSKGNPCEPGALD